MSRMLLLLRRPPELEAAFAKRLKDLHDQLPELLSLADCRAGWSSVRVGAGGCKRRRSLVAVPGIYRRHRLRQRHRDRLLRNSRPGK